MSFTAQVSVLVAITKATSTMAASARRANDAISKNDQLVEKLRSESVVGYLFDQYMELVEFTKKNPLFDKTGLLRMEQIIRMSVGGVNQVNFNLLRSGRTSLRPREQDSGYSGDFLGLMKKMGILKTR